MGLIFLTFVFFQPKKLFLFKDNSLTIKYLNYVSDEVDADLKSIEAFSLQNESSHKNDIHIESRISKKYYINKVSTMLSHIHRGDIYEANFCQEFYAHADMNPLETYFKLNEIAQAPFATFFKNGDKYLLSSSPERYLKKVGLEIISQPIKGTTKRSEHPEEDADLKTTLECDPKERSENIMIVDLVRNDLSKNRPKRNGKRDRTLSNTQL